MSFSRGKEIKVTSCSCAPPGCPEVEVYELCDGELMVIISDDYQHCCTMSKKQFEELIKNYTETIMEK